MKTMNDLSEYVILNQGLTMDSITENILERITTEEALGRGRDQTLADINKIRHGLDNILEIEESPSEVFLKIIILFSTSLHHACLEIENMDPLKKLRDQKPGV